MKMKMLQIQKLHRQTNLLHKKFGSRNLRAVHGAGCIRRPEAMFVFINPTGKNVSAHPLWKGIRAQWLGTKQVWKLFYAADILSERLFLKTQKLQSYEWNARFSEKLYADIAKHKAYVTNFAKCTQDTAQPIGKEALRAYLPLFTQEIITVQPKRIVTFGNEISSLIVGSPVSVNDYHGTKHECMDIGTQSFKVYPTYYPVGQGMRNMPKAIRRIRMILGIR